MDPSCPFYGSLPPMKKLGRHSSHYPSSVARIFLRRFSANLPPLRDSNVAKKNRATPNLQKFETPQKWETFPQSHQYHGLPVSFQRLVPHPKNEEVHIDGAIVGLVTREPVCHRWSTMVLWWSVPMVKSSIGHPLSSTVIYVFCWKAWQKKTPNKSRIVCWVILGECSTLYHWVAEKNQAPNSPNVTGRKVWYFTIRFRTPPFLKVWNPQLQGD